MKKLLKLCVLFILSIIMSLNLTVLPVYASDTILDLSAELGSTLSASTNPDPNTLATKSPYPTPFIAPMVVGTAWSAQGRVALFPIGLENKAGPMPIKLHFLPSAGNATTYTITVWMYNRQSNTWAKPFNTATVSYTGEAIDYIDQPGNDPIFLQISNVSSGTLSVFYDASVATAL
jgi:hypothetical protein